jgi:hypothetical protein
MFNLQWIQHPAGHGGFHTGHLDVPGEGSFNWAFDCGSRKTGRFNEYLQAWSRQFSQSLDWLFISHFDTDHVSGLDTLMSRFVVSNVMVPYLNNREFAYLLLHEIARDNLDRTLVEIAADPVRFFVSRGADRVVFLRGRRPDVEPGRFEGAPDGPKDERGWYTAVNPVPWAVRSNAQRAGASQAPGRAQVVDGGVCEIDCQSGAMGVHLKAYRAPVQPYALRGLVKAMEDLLGTRPVRPLQPGLGALAYAIARHARTRAGRAEILGVYK